MPEIYEGIVEVKSISRAVGDRTKIAVCSKDEKVDCVGACVGMRGPRVKNIVSESQGEKMDIVRYSDDIKEYIQASLSPAEISQIQINPEDKKANLIVADDQLSLSIGKKGQNIRLASELVGWELNVFTAEQWQDGQDEEDDVDDTGTMADETPDSKNETGSNFDGLEGIGEKFIELLKEYDYDSIEKIASASVGDLTQIKGLGKIKAEKLIKQAKSLLGDA